jgi:hypothetical protein
MSGLAIVLILFVIIIMVLAVIDRFASPLATKVFTGVLGGVLKSVNFLIALWIFRIAISVEAFEAIARTLPLGSVAVEPEPNAKGEREIWLDDAMVDRLGAMRGPGESYSDVIMRIAGRDGACAP